MGKRSLSLILEACKAHPQISHHFSNSSSRYGPSTVADYSETWYEIKGKESNSNWHLSDAVFINCFSKLKYCVINLISLTHNVLYSINTGISRERTVILCVPVSRQKLDLDWRWTPRARQTVERTISICKGGKAINQTIGCNNGITSFLFLLLVPNEKKEKEKSDSCSDLNLFPLPLFKLCENEDRFVRDFITTSYSWL